MQFGISFWRRGCRAGPRALPARQSARGCVVPRNRQGLGLSGASLLLLATLGCIGSSGGDAHLPAGTETLEARLGKPGLSLLAIGDLANELGERYEDAGRHDVAETHYGQAVWAYRHAAFLLDRAPPLLEDAAASLERVRETRRATATESGDPEP
ncbi:MAG: hypothetical protein ACOCX4_02460 [Planctomycetota bacterium]